MQNPIKIGIIGDYDPQREACLATVRALQQAAGQLALRTEISWLPTKSFPSVNGLNDLEAFDAFWVSPGSPYFSRAGALVGISLARGTGKPLFGT